MAELAGSSVDWYMRLEQGRNSLPSKMTAEALAKALEHNATDRAHLLRLALAHLGRIFKKEIVPYRQLRNVHKLSDGCFVEFS